MENELQSEIDAIENTHSGYDEYRYDLDTIGHNPHELASYLTCLLYTSRPERNGFNRVREALTAGRVSDKSAEHNQF